MKQELISKWLDRCIDHEAGNDDEGGYWDDPVGGPTKWGISQRSYPNINIKNLTKEEACDIYVKDYINPIRLDRYPIGVAFQLFDFGVNSGPLTALKQLQESLGLKPDGIIGPITLAKLDRTSDSDLVMLVAAERLEYMSYLKNLLPNARGWLRRMAKNLRYGAEDTD